jgi:hypothetical protein
MNNNTAVSNSESKMINAALELLTSSGPNPSSFTDETSKAPTKANSFNTVAPEGLLDWRLEVSQTERYQVIQRL